MAEHASSKVPYAFAIGGGALPWLATSALSGRNERWGLAVMLAQAATLALTSAMGLAQLAARIRLRGESAG